MPQLDFSTYASQIFWLFLCMGLLILFSIKFTLPKTKALFQKRWHAIQGNRQEADTLYGQFKALCHRRETEIQKTKATVQDALEAAKKQHSKERDEEKHRLHAILKQGMNQVEKEILKETQANMAQSADLTKDLLTTLKKTFETHRNSP